MNKDCLFSHFIYTNPLYCVFFSINKNSYTPAKPTNEHPLTNDSLIFVLMAVSLSRFLKQINFNVIQAGYHILFDISATRFTWVFNFKLKNCFLECP